MTYHIGSRCQPSSSSAAAAAAAAAAALLYVMSIVSQISERSFKSQVQVITKTNGHM